MEINSDLTSRLPIKQHIRNLKKVGGVIHGLDKKQFPLAAAVEFLKAVNTYLALLLSVWVLNGVTGAVSGAGALGDSGGAEQAGGSGGFWNGIFGVGQGTLMAGIIAFLAGIFLCQVIISILTNRRDVRRSAAMGAYDRLVTEKITDMDFSIVDSPVLKNIRLRMYKDNNWGAGIYSFFYGFDWFVSQCFNILGALAVGVPVLVQIFHTRNLAALLLTFASLGFAVVSSLIFTKKEAYANGFLLRDMFESHEEMARKAGLVWPLADGELYGYQNGKDVRLYEADELFDEYTYGRMRKYEQEKVHWMAVLTGKAQAYGSGTEQLVNAVPYLIVALAAQKGGLAAGTLVGCAGALTRLFGSVRGIFGGLGQMASASRKQLSTLELLEMADEMYKGKLPVEKRSDNQYEIEFSHVWFAYPGSENYALKDFCFKMRVGKKLAIVGMNGSGKTTMIKLLCRLYEPTKGQILLNGVDIRKFDMKEYRQLFSVVFQDLQLFSLKLGENVAGSSCYDRKLAASCLEMAGFGARLNALPEGLDSYLYKEYADDGVEISGGEAQKIAIARALYKDAPFVLLDEPTAALDPLAEYEIYSRFDQMVGTKTAIYISHRLSSCRFCDDIAVFHEGQLVQRGSHEELVGCTDGKYFELWQAQAQYYQ